jgi:hypothetical protein
LRRRRQDEYFEFEGTNYRQLLDQATGVRARSRQHARNNVACTPAAVGAVSHARQR